MTELFGYVDCGGVPEISEDLTGLPGTDWETYVLRGASNKKILTNWFNCHLATTDRIVFEVMGISPLVLNEPDQTYYFEAQKFREQSIAHLNIMDDAARSILSSDLEVIHQQIIILSTDVENNIIDTLDAIALQTGVIIDEILRPIESSFEEVIILEEVILSKIVTLTDETLELGESIITDVQEGILTPILGTLRTAADFLSIRLNEINITIQDEIGFANVKLNEIVEAVQGVIRGELVIAATIATEMDALITGLPAGFDEIFRDIGNDLLGNAGTIFDQLINVLLERGRGKIDEFLQDMDKPTREIINNIFKVIEGPAGLHPVVRQLTNEALHNPISIAGAALFTVASFLLAAFLSIATKPEQELLLQEHSKQVAWQIPPIDVLISGLRREFIGEDVLTDSAQRIGFDQADIDLFKKVDKLQFDSLTIIELWRRNFITEDQMFKRLEKIGYEPEDQDLIKAKSEIIPGVGDLIRFMVRDVFSPEVTARFGQFEDFPPQFEEFGKQIGLNTFWAQNYWAAHWELPGIRLAFEMLHRGIIETEDLDLLLKAKDIMPFWREPIKAVAFKPFTRVDVRRMHKLKLLTDDELIRAYKDLGYDEEKADKLAQFTIELNFPKPFIEFSNPVETPQRQIEGFLRRGVINSEDANELLVLLGYEIEDAKIIVRSIDLFDELIRREEKTSDIIDLATVGTITIEQAEDTLYKLNFETEEVTRTLDKINTERGKRLKVPDLDTLNRMLKKKLIGTGEYLDAVQNSGYSLQWAERFLKLTGN